MRIMRIEKRLDRDLRRYVLGPVDPDTRLALEQGIVTKPDVFNALGAVEDEVAEDYLEGGLTDSERRTFERHFRSNQDLRGRVALIRLLRRNASRHAADFESARTAHRSRHRVTLSSWWVGAIAASILVLAAGNVWLKMTANRLSAELAQQAAATTADRQRATPVAPTVPPATPTARSPLRESTGPVAQPTFALVAGTLRGESAITRVVIPHGAQTIRLALPVPAAQYGRYKVAVLNAEGDELWTVMKLEVDRQPEGTAVVVVAPAAMFELGDYQARLSGSDSNGRWDEIATYTFRVIIEAGRRY
jgi:anti-sigma factor RsiW